MVGVTSTERLATVNMSLVWSEDSLMKGFDALVGSFATTYDIGTGLDGVNHWCSTPLLKQSQVMRKGEVTMHPSVKLSSLLALLSTSSSCNQLADVISVMKLTLDDPGDWRIRDIFLKCHQQFPVSTFRTALFLTFDGASSASSCK